MRYAYNTVVKWNKNQVKPQILSEKLKLYFDKRGKRSWQKRRKIT